MEQWLQHHPRAGLEQWLQRHPEAGSSWPSWPKASYSADSGHLGGEMGAGAEPRFQDIQVDHVAAELWDCKGVATLLP